MPMMEQAEAASMYWTGQTPWVPHYSIRDVYVAPGGVERTESQLLKMGAVKAPTFLWPRHWQTKGNPGPVSKKSSSELLLEWMQQHDEVVAANDVSKSLGWSSCRVRDALHKLKSEGKVVEWGQRTARNEAQMWVLT